MTYRLPVVYTINAVQEYDRLFPRSKHRSKRIKKKLEKRYGGPECKWKPCIFRMGKGMYEKYIAHPAFQNDIETAFNEISYPYR